MYEKITSFIKVNHPHLIKTNQRLAVVFHDVGNENTLLNFMAGLCQQRKLVISSRLNDAIVAEQAASKLGEEYDLVLFDARDSFNPDALGIVSGVLCGGGFLLILLPNFKQWVSNQSLFYQYMSGFFANQAAVYYVSNNHSVEKNIDKKNTNETKQSALELYFPYKSKDQFNAVVSIVKLLRENDDVCCVLTSGRGRGKSSALGFIVKELMISQQCDLIISAPKLSVAGPLFLHLKNQCPEGVDKRAEFIYKKSNIKFIAPDLLLEKLPVADVLFIDEAAVVPISMLQKLLLHYPKIIFSTTTHGYEGTGRGFELKFYKLLNEVKSGWEKIQLHQPVRWSINDPLETWIESILFLNVKLAVKPTIPDVISKCQFVLLDRYELIHNKSKLESVFSLLVFAHYRTSPSDFQYLLNSENIRIYSLEFNNNVLAVLVVNQEGGFDTELSTAIYRGERRPRGHLLAQTLCFHAGSESAAELLYARVMRIAVHPEIQQRGLGSELLNRVIDSERALGMNVIGSSFSATPRLLNFWERAGLSLLRMGFKRDHVTASNSAVMAKPLNASAEKMINELNLRFKQNISLWLQGPLLNLCAEIKNHSLLAAHQSSFNLQDLKDVESFAKFNRNYDVCMPAIIRFIKDRRSDFYALNDVDHKMVLLSEQYMNNWKSIVSHSDNLSKAQAIKQLRLALVNLLKIYK